MGLDMYLTKKTYIKNWDHMKDSERHTVTITGPAASQIKPERIAYIEEEVAYWRKANHIHAFFVANAQDGKDDCGSYYVSRYLLERLVDVCKKVISESVLVDAAVQRGARLGPDTGGEWVPVLEDGKQVENFYLAKALLPRTDGFFFGSGDYDEYYIQDCEDTVRMLQPLLREDGEFYYRSSW